MNFVLGRRSLRHLQNVHPLLVTGVHYAIDITPLDFAIICGHRNEHNQNQAYSSGLSGVRWPDSKHNDMPSLAVDFVPWPVDWKDSLAFARIATAIQIGVKLAQQEDSADPRWRDYTTRWGGDWDRDGSSRDQTFMDLGHIELR